MVRDDPGAARLALVGGVVHLDEPAAVFDAMLTDWERQQRSRGLVEATVVPRIALVRRFQDFAETYPWEWTPADVEDFTVSLMGGAHRLAPSTIRSYHLTLRMRGGIPKRRTVLAVPEFDWIIDGMRQWVEEGRWLADPKNHPALWVTERRSRVDIKRIDRRFRWAVAEQVGHRWGSTTAIYTSVSNGFKNRTLKAALARVYADGEPK
jgi:hypothetical protein